MSSDPGRPTLDQLRVLITVVETGSFAAAARTLNRANSVISYTIANLEAQLGLTLFDRRTTRKPSLTPAGRIVLTEARILTTGLDSLRAKVGRMLQGLEGELHVALDSMLPSERVVDALTAFGAEFPTVGLHLHVETLGAVADLVLDKVASIGVSGPLALEYDALHRVNVGTLRMVPVAAPTHPLASPPPGGLSPGAGREHTQLVIYDRSALTAGRDFHVIGNRTWRLADLASKHMLLRAGLGWGVMPRWMVAEDIRKGRLVTLAMPDLAAFDFPVDVIYRVDTPLGPAATWLTRRFGQQAQAKPALHRLATRTAATKPPTRRTAIAKTDRHRETAPPGQPAIANTGPRR
ncbi:LysR family transcriptional regulator [Rhodopila sp.]|uniref:LysR family transcriptional regulator n=1 Tax=Rhodopila sp. TaxID=2480087 RepID=UPI003D0CA8F9